LTEDIQASSKVRTEELPMKRICRLLTVGLVVAAIAPRLRGADKEGTLVELGNLKSRTPPNWKEEPVTGQLRAAQFRLPKAEGDQRDAEVVIFQNITGSTQANIDRWKGQFIPPDGKTMKDVATVTEMKIGDADVTALDIHGTYKLKFPPNDPNAKEVLRPNFRMIAVVFNVKDKPYHIRFVGPAKTVEQYKKGFDDWLNAFK
jgi:hypothetical protein